jgi:hypothetical protein
MFSPLTLLKTLIEEYPNSYVKIGNDKYVPVRKELFNFEYVRYSSDAYTRGFVAPTHKNIPILFSCDQHEEIAFHFLHEQLIHGVDIRCVFDPSEQLNYMLLLFRIANSEEIKMMVSKIDLDKSVFRELSSLDLNLDLISVFSRKRRINICCNIKNEPELWKYGFFYWCTKKEFIDLADPCSLNKMWLYRTSTSTLHKPIIYNKIVLLDAEGIECDFLKISNNIWCNCTLTVGSDVDLCYLMNLDPSQVW